VVGLHRAGGGGEGEHVVDGGDDLEGALVAVAHDARDPFRIDDAGADDAGDLLLERAGQRVLGARMVVVIGGGAAAGE
jgi:hypothetical protein